MSCVLLDTNSIFVRNMKIAGSSLNSYLKKEKTYNCIFLTFNNSNVHVNLEQIVNILGYKRVLDFWTFTIIRNPWDWFVSLYKYIKQTPIHPLHFKYKQTEFSEFLNTFTKKKYSKQIDFIKYEDLTVNSVFKYEELDFYWPFIKFKLNLDGDLPRINVIPHKQYQEYYNAQTKDLVFLHEQEIIKNFQYEF